MVTGSTTTRSSGGRRESTRRGPRRPCSRLTPLGRGVPHRRVSGVRPVRSTSGRSNSRTESLEAIQYGGVGPTEPVFPVVPEPSGPDPPVDSVYATSGRWVDESSPAGSSPAPLPAATGQCYEHVIYNYFYNISTIIVQSRARATSANPPVSKHVTVIDSSGQSGPGPLQLYGCENTARNTTRDRHPARRDTTGRRGLVHRNDLCYLFTSARR